MAATEQQPQTAQSSLRALRWTAVLLTGTVWASAALFGVYILLFFAGALYAGEPEQWNQTLPRLYDPAEPVATASIAAHFIAGGVILALGPLQLLEGVRRRAPSLHRWTGRVYILTTLTAGLGGTLFILLQGTVGGMPMNLGFGLYGLLMIWASVATVRHAMARRLDQHRAWGLRLFALAIGSWLYRMEYGFWFAFLDGVGHTDSFDGPFDVVMAFFFYLPNLAVVEVILRARRPTTRPGLRWMGVVLLLAATGFLVLATLEFTRIAWAPGIQAGLDWFGR